MKKIICCAFLLTVVLASLVSCSTFKCDLCNQEKTGKSYDGEVEGKEITYCEDCYEAWNKID